MLQDGDKVMVAVSGGKDSLSLLKVLQYRQSFIPISVELLAVHVESGIPNFPLQKLTELFESWEARYHIEKIDFLNGKAFEEIDCFWCSWNRRKVLFELAQRLGFNKIAFGHHIDDIVETILMNLFYRGEIGAMRPKQELFNGKLTIIRPFAYETEAAIQQLAEAEGILNVDQFQCPHNETSKRTMIKRLLFDLEKESPAIKMNIFKSLQNVKTDYLLDTFAENPIDFS
jgi:tRNA 2-thiocytidine biosynthesis protein TtcA